MKSNQNVVLILFAIGVFMAALDNGIISAALTTIIYSFDVSPTWGAWSITIYTLGLGISLPIAGKLSDRFGRKRLFLIEVFLFGLGSLLVALSQSFPMFIVSRFIQSLGGGGIFIIASSYILSVFPKEKQGRALGMLGGMNGIAAVLGPNIGSFILNLSGSWHWLFLINLPIAVGLMIFGFSAIKETKEFKKAPLDWSGVLLLTFAVLSLMYGLTNLEGAQVWESMMSPNFYGFVIVGLALLVSLFMMERRVSRKGKDPILPMNLLENASYKWTLLIGFFSGAILASVIFIPAYVEQYLGVPTELSGYWFTPLAIASGIGAGGGGAMVDRKGPIFTLVVASILSIIGFLLFPLWVETTWQMVIASCLAGIGFGMMLGAPVNVLAGESTKTDQGSALGTVSLFRQLAMTIAPTIYAGFIARSFLDIGENMTAALQKAGVDLSTIPKSEVEKYMNSNGDFQSIISGVEQIPDPVIRDTILNVVHQTAGQGFHMLFTTAAIVSMLTLVSVMILGKIRGKQSATDSSHLEKE